MTLKRFGVLDLFCGAGGLSYGFESAGFNIVLGIDNNEMAIKTYNHNHKYSAGLCCDITQVNFNDTIKPIIEDRVIDVIIGGPPCQGFSISGKRLIDDPRNKLYKSFVDMVRDIMPKIFVMENVPGLISMAGGKIKEQIVEDFQSLGYIVNTKQLIASDYGVPQSRKRVFFVGINAEKIHNTREFIFPSPTHGEREDLLDVVTCKEAISDLDFISEEVALPEKTDYILPAQSDYQKSMRAGSRHLLNHSAIIHTKKTRQIISMVPDGGNYKSLPEELWSTRKVNIAWTRMNSSKPCFTIDTGHNHHFHYSANRVPTVRESARIQSFPDKFEFLGIKTSQLKQVGNAVPPLLAQVIADKVREILEKETN